MAKRKIDAVLRIFHTEKPTKQVRFSNLKIDAYNNTSFREMPYGRARNYFYSRYGDRLQGIVIEEKTYKSDTKNYPDGKGKWILKGYVTVVE